MIHIYTILGFLSLILILIAIIVFTKSILRFHDGEFRRCLNALMIALYLMAIPYILFVIRDSDMVMSGHTEISYIIYSFMILVSLFLLIAAMKLNDFSKVYGLSGCKKK